VPDEPSGPEEFQHVNGIGEIVQGLWSAGGDNPPADVPMMAAPTNPIGSPSACLWPLHLASWVSIARYCPRRPQPQPADEPTVAMLTNPSRN